MPVPFEALLPWGIIATMFGVTGVGLYYTKQLGNEGKKTRWNRDLWDRVSHSSTPSQSAAVGRTRSECPLTLVQQMMERDLRLTGTWRGQSSNHQAPPGFELSNQWKIERRMF
ncbi:hypothetical protein N7533_008132 [Penicillium manginii]|uniref:uncharacterized protein n=1 Tax=Penicillium manginii TaxID=203109 RepID=UPI0025498C56|nr:uncharacterized protein N7533_008132 [Penicillium manginii]KAJ5751104.1 hypothetical protein N7533_008132 [Penicillium manginii]